MKEKDIFSFKICKFPFIFYFHFLCNMKMKIWYFDLQLIIWDLNRNYSLLSYQKKRRRQKLMTELFSFEMRNHASFTEMNMMLMTVTKAQLLSFDSWNMRYTSSKLSDLLKNVTIIKTLFFLINRFCLSCAFFFL